MAMQAYRPPTATLEARNPFLLCEDALKGTCKSETCTPDRHAMCPILSPEFGITVIKPIVANVLTMKARKADCFDGEYEAGPFAANGPRHDNDFKTIANIKVLPTTDEVS